MKVYLVGGAVRDQLLGLPIKEKDWVVVGATPDALLRQQYQQVGRDFPVFLHPHTKEEYALARTERKSAPGYYGFACDFSDTVTLEEDLARRDLTINAMAMDEAQRIIDPYQGRADIQNKILRHVSPAFVEDPVRVLRIARFAARLHHLGFTVADETRALMYRMVKAGELAHLVPERVWQEWEESLTEKNPEQFLLTLRACGALAVVLPEIDALFGVPNPRKYHAEVDTGIHTLLTLQAATALSTSPITRFAATVHDVGKALTPMALWPKHYQHEEKGLPLIEALCTRLRIPTAYKTLALMVCRFHLTVHRLAELRPGTVVKVLEKTDAFRRPSLFTNLLLACQADAMGCGRDLADHTLYQQNEQWHYMLAQCATIKPQDIIALGHQGRAIKEIQHEQRVACVTRIIKSWKAHEK